MVIIRALEELIGLNPELQRYKVAYGAIPSGSDEIVILTRSVIQNMIQIASFIEVAAQHMHRTLQTFFCDTDQEANLPHKSLHTANGAIPLECRKPELALT